MRVIYCNNTCVLGTFFQYPRGSTFLSPRVNAACPSPTLSRGVRVGTIVLNIISHSSYLPFALRRIIFWRSNNLPSNFSCCVRRPHLPVTHKLRLNAKICLKLSQLTFHFQFRKIFTLREELREILRYLADAI